MTTGVVGGGGEEKPLPPPLILVGTGVRAESRKPTVSEKCQGRRVTLLERDS